MPLVNFLLTCVFFLSLNSAFTQDQFLFQLADKVKDRAEKYPKELIYIQSPQPYGFSGEKYWYQLYLLDARKYYLHSFSSTAYVELWSEKKQLIARQKLRINGGQSSGHFELAGTLETGLYLLRAYTQWMQNFDSNDFYRKTVLIVNPVDLVKKRDLKVQKTPSIPKEEKLYFYPEGGVLLRGCPNQITVRTEKKQESNQEKIEIWDEKAQLLTTCHLSKDGFGVFDLLPDVSKQYVAYYNGKKYSLPIVQESGFSIRLDKKRNGVISGKIYTSSRENGKYYLLAFAREEIHFSRPIPWGNKEFHFELSSKELPAGIIQLMIVNLEGKICNERLFYNHLTEEVKINLDVLPAKILPRSQAEITLGLANEKQSAFHSDFSFSILYKDSLSDLISSKEHIQSYLFFRSRINPPGFEILRNFNGNNTEVIDLLCTSLKGSSPDFEQLLSGTEPAIRLQREEVQFPFESRSKEKEIPGFDKNDSLTLLTAEIQWESIYPSMKLHHFRHRIWEEYNLQSVMPEEKAADFFQFDFQVKLKDYVKFESLFEMLHEIVPPLRLYKKKGKFQTQILNSEDSRNKYFLKGEPLYLIDRLKVNSVEDILALSPDQIESIGLIWKNESLSHSQLGPLANFGILSINTIRQNFARQNKDFPLLYSSYLSVLQYPEKNWANEKQKLFPIFEPLLTWKTALIMNRQGKTKQVFFTNDLCGTFVIKLEGISKDGTPFFIEKLIKIQFR